MATIETKAMWAVYKRTVRIGRAADGGDEVQYWWYRGSNGNWAGDSRSAARWVDRRDAYLAIISGGAEGGMTCLIDDGGRVDPDQIVPEEIDRRGEG